jgi:hypothetical protein
MSAIFSHAGGAEQRLNQIRPEQMATQPNFTRVADEVCEACALNTIHNKGYVPVVPPQQTNVSAAKPNATTTTSISNPYAATFDSSITSFLKLEFNNITSEQIAHGQKRVFEAMAGTGPFAITDELLAMDREHAVIF